MWMVLFLTSCDCRGVAMRLDRRGVGGNGVVFGWKIGNASLVVADGMRLLLCDCMLVPLGAIYIGADVSIKVSTPRGYWIYFYSTLGDSYI
mmetsp:Transcript_11030/g.10552  ORF Transcript_11030/g.10552 Transcript_11030/m.10552 type:complete len:91 (+) Transcript_11030:149-421(+)